MNEHLKTIKELADELGVSKQAIRKYFDKLPFELIPKKEKGTYLLNKDIQEFIKNKVKPVDSEVDTSTKPVDRLKDEIIFDKNKQINHLENQINKLTNLLDQQQRLALQDKKLLEEYKSEINDLKALKIPSQDSTEEETGKQSQEADSNLKFGNKALQEQISEQAKIDQKEGSRKWYQFWKR